MKKILAIIMVVCMMAGVLYVPALAAEPASDVVIRVSALTKDGTVIAIENSDYKTFVEGWEAAVLLATNPDLMDQNHYERIVVDFYADWKADKEGKFGDSDLEGIQYDTILVPANTKMTVNLNGHTIDRGLGDKNENNGEVICVSDNADLIINGGKSGDPIVRADTEVKNVQLGTITGGNSDNGAGGIHIQDGAKVILNNVNIVGNVTDDDDGAGIAVYDGASLYMSGGGFINNRNHSFSRSYYKAQGGAIYVDDSTVEFHNVLFRNNQFTYETGFGVAIYAYRSTVTLDECEVVDNGHWIEDKKLKGSFSTIHGYESKLVIKNTSFTANGSNETTDSFGNGNNMIEIDSSSLLLLDGLLTHVSFVENIDSKILILRICCGKLLTCSGERP